MSERQQPRAKNIAHANDGGHGPLPSPWIRPCAQTLIFFINFPSSGIYLPRSKNNNRTSIALTACRSVFGKNLFEKSGFKSRWTVVDRNCRGSEFQTDGAESRKGRLEKSVLVNGWTSSVMAGERRFRLLTRSAIRIVPVILQCLYRLLKLAC